MPRTRDERKRRRRRRRFVAGAVVLAFAALGVVRLVTPRSEPPLRFWIHLPNFDDAKILARRGPSVVQSVGAVPWTYSVEGPREAPRGEPIRGWEEVEWQHVTRDEGSIVAQPSVVGGWLVRLGIRKPGVAAWTASRLVTIPTPPGGLSLWIRPALEFPAGASPDPRAVGTWEAADGIGGSDARFDLEAGGICRVRCAPLGANAGAVLRWAVADDCLLIDPGPPAAGPGAARGAPAAPADFVVGMFNADRTECWRVRKPMLRRRGR